MASPTISLTPPRHIPVSGIAHNIPKPAYTKTRCPRCDSQSLTLQEYWNTSIEWTVTNGWLDRANGNMDSGGGGGEPFKVVAICTCGHQWTVRKAHQIDAVLEELRP